MTIYTIHIAKIHQIYLTLKNFLTLKFSDTTQILFPIGPSKFLWQQRKTLEALCNIVNVENVVLSITDVLLMLKSRDTLVNLTRKVCLLLIV